MWGKNAAVTTGRRRAMAGFAAGLLATPAVSARAQLGGNAVNVVVTYSGRYVLSPEAHVTVGLYAEPPGERRATLVTEKSLVGPGQVPITVSLDYDPGNIDPSTRYTVMAHIDDRGRRRFESRAGLPVITRNSPFTVTLILTAS
jgi:uncharacterized lipoprotein YbaY